MNLKKWCEVSENIHAELAREYFNMEVGLKYSETKIKNLEQENLKHSLYFLKHFKKPKELVSGSVGGVAGAKTFSFELKLDKLRKTKICSKFKGKKVCWTNWRTFAVTADDKTRKQIYDEFIKKTPIISPVIKKKFEISKKIYQSYGLDPLTEYLEDHKISLKELKRVLITLRDGVKKHFKKEFSIYTQKLLGREPRYCDDLYYMRNKIFEDMIKGFKGVDGLKQIKKTQKWMGFNPEKIKIDSAQRHNKAPSPFCMMAKIPTDIRISFKKENPLNDTNSVFHEMGHAIHGCTIDAKLPYWKRYGMSRGLDESFSIFFEGILHNKTYLTDELKLKEDYADEFIKRTMFIELLAKAFYTGNSLFKIDFWDKNLKFEKTNAHYAKQLKQSMGMKIPGQYWLLHHILPESLLYVPSYMLAEINALQMHDFVENKYGKKWWRNKKAGDYLKKMMKPGADSPLGNFKKVNVKKYVKRFLTII